MRKNTKFLPVFGVLAALLLSSCGGNAASQTEEPVDVSVHTLDELVTAAQEEGEVLVYTTLTEPDVDRLTEDFKEAYGIDITTMRLGSNEGITRFDPESEANASTADILLAAETRYFSDGIERRYLVPIDEAGIMEFLPDYPDELLVPDSGTAIVNITNAGWVYNTDEVSEDELPETWGDLLDPRWEGKLVGPPITDEINNLMTMGMVADTYGMDYLTELHGQLLREYPDMVPMHEAVATGEGHLGLQSIEFFVDVLASDGAPLGFVSVAPAYYPVHALGVNNHAESPAAARLLAHYLLSEEGSKSVAAGVGVYTPYNADIPEDFSVPTGESIDQMIEKRAELQEAYN